MSYMKDSANKRLDEFIVADEADLDAEILRATTAETALQTDLDGVGQVAYAPANTAVVVSFTNTAVYNAGAIVAIPPSTRDTWITWQATIGLTTAADGAVLSAVYDVTSTPALKEARTSRCRTTDVAFGLWASHYGEFNAGPSTTWRSYALYGLTTRDAAGAYPVAYFHNNFFGYGKCWIAGVTR